VQRFFDIVFSLLALALLCPLLLPVALVLRVTGEGEVFFLQKRVGKNGKLFSLYKFATMLKESPNIGSGTVTLRDDPRVLPLGKFLRKTKINELPQLLNVLLGDMSVVGPRPQTPRCFEVFPNHLKKVIVKVSPGLSGLGPIVFRDEENILAEKEASIDFYDQVIAPYKGQVEAYYVENQGMFIYFATIFATIWVLVTSNPRTVWKLFRGLPKPPPELTSKLNYPKD
jgi:lipopolysaccharide/colanic/teichoic acid biosynthesis glycosyltransferase